MSFDKHQNFVQEMTVTFSSGKVGEDGTTVTTPVEPEVTEPMPTTGYVAVDQFSNAANDMIKNFLNPVAGGSVGEMNHAVEVPDLEHNEAPEEMEIEDNQIGFEYVDGKLHIAIDGNDIYLSNDAIEALKDYLSNIDITDSDDSEETETDESDDEADTEEADDSDDSEESSEDDEKVEEALRFEDTNPKSKKCKCGKLMKYDSHNQQYKCVCGHFEKAPSTLKNQTTFK